MCNFAEYQYPLSMKTNIIKLAIIIAFVGAHCMSAQGSEPRKCLAKDAGRLMFEQRLSRPERFPISFTYGGKAYKGLGGLKLKTRNVTATSSGREAVMRLWLDEEVEVKTVAKYNDEFGEVEYTVWFTNISTDRPSKVLEKVLSADIQFAGSDPVLRGNLGDLENRYAPYSRHLAEAPVSFRSVGGRATHVYFPYFDLVHGSGGTLLAIGWAGTWNTSFSSKGSSTLWQAANCNDFSSVLLPGETMRTALIVMLPYKGRSSDEASNLWREWFVKYNTPKANADGQPLEPFSTTNFASDTGLPNSDGSISERFFTWRRTLDMLVYERVKPDFRWIDAGWYSDPQGRSVPQNWWSTIGSWELDSIKWPGNSFRISNETCHSQGMKVILWFEPERVTNVEALAKNYGYNPEWAIDKGKTIITNNLGNADCLRWTLGRITSAMDKGAIDLYREDNNSDPGGKWPVMDKESYEATGLPRTGSTENKAIQGHYALWDSIIAHCAATGKCTFIDNCASGGGRNDIESLRRSIPLLRSDADRTTTSLRLSMTSTFNKWIPYCGASTKESIGQLEAGASGGSSLYVTRASWLPVYNIDERFTHDVNLDYDRLRQSLAEWKAYNHLLVKDFHVLTPWHSGDDTSGWTVLAYNDRDTGEGIVEAFRQENSNDSTFIARLGFLSPKVKYTLRNIDTGSSITLSGRELAERGITITLPEAKSSCVLHFCKAEEK